MATGPSSQFHSRRLRQNGAARIAGGFSIMAAVQGDDEAWLAPEMTLFSRRSSRWSSPSRRSLPRGASSPRGSSVIASENCTGRAPRWASLEDALPRDVHSATHLLLTSIASAVITELVDKAQVVDLGKVMASNSRHGSGGPTSTGALTPEGIGILYAKDKGDSTGHWRGSSNPLCPISFV